MTFKRNYYIEDFTDPKTFLTLFLGSWVPQIKKRLSTVNFMAFLCDFEQKMHHRTQKIGHSSLHEVWPDGEGVYRHTGKEVRGILG